MSVEFTYRNGRVVNMEKRFADILQKMNRGSYQTIAAIHYNTRDMRANVLSNVSPSQPHLLQPDILISDAVRKFAEENSINISGITGTGKDGRINKNDIEDAIAARNKTQD